LPTAADDKENKDHRKDRIVGLFGGRLAVTQRQLGLLGAVFNGAWGGLNLIPLHYAHSETMV
jgi:hypothetical protein